MINSLLLFIAISTAPTDSVEYQTPAQLIAQATEYQNNDENEKAREIYLSISENDTSYVEAQANLMIALNNLEEYDASIAIGKEIKELKTEFRKSIYMSLGSAYLNSGELEKALATYQEGLTHYPYYHILMYNAGYTCYKMEDFPQAINYFQQSAKINPFYSSNHVMLGYISMLQGHLTKAILSYTTSLTIEPEQNSILVFIENLASLKTRQSGSIPAFENNSAFQYYDDLIRSEAALDSRFKRKVDFNASIVKQSELLYSKLKYQASTGDFWMDFYVPFFTELESNELSPALIYYILSSSDNEDALAWIDKNKDLKTQWVDLANASLKKNREVLPADILGEKRDYQYWYFNSHTLSAIGNERADESRYGPWKIYYENGQLQTIGRYDESGNHVGEWTYYHENGEVSRIEQYGDDGLISEPAVYFTEKGVKNITAAYKDNEVDGEVNFYYPCGQLKETLLYEKGDKNGPGKFFNKTGQLEITYTIKDNEQTDLYTYYHKNGLKSSIYSYAEGKLNGEYESYYDNGQLNEKGTYLDGLKSSEWKGYSFKGNLTYEGNFVEDNRVGEWRFYHENGQLDELNTYNDAGELHGATQIYAMDGRLQYDKVYDAGKLTSFKAYGSNNQILFEAQSSEGNMPYKNFYSTDELLLECTVADGKYNGSYKKYYKSGNLRIETTMVDNFFDGSYTEYFKSGQLKIDCGYKAGDYHGLYKSYYSNGQLEQEGWYIDGKLEGRWLIYHNDGALKEDVYYIDNQINGTDITYAEKGKIHRRWIFDEGTMIGLHQFDTLGNVYSKIDLPYGSGDQVLKSVSGTTIISTAMQCGAYVSDVNTYFTDKQIYSTLPIKNGQYEGEYKLFDREGQIQLTGQYVNNERDGLWTGYHSNGVRKSERTYVNGESEGVDNNYFSNGQMSSQCADIEDTQLSKCTYFDQTGHVQLEKYYHEDEGVLSYINVKSQDSIIVTRKGDFTLQSYFANGQLAAEQVFLDGQFHGINRYFNQDGSPSEKTEYRHGENHGSWIVYHPNGKIFTDTPYQYEQKHGVEKEYFPSGQIKRETPYVYDEISGMEIIYHPNGTVKLKTQYWNGYVY